MTQKRLQSYNYKNRYFLKAFLLGIGVSFLFFLPFILYDQGYFLYYGDFNVQQVPFYQMIHDAVRSGNLFWSWTTDLGANTIGSYSFYLMGSPFFWLTLPFPSEAVPYLMGPLLILKFGCASLTGYIYLRRYVGNQGYALIGGMLYAFSGFSVYNIFFNHFHEAIVIFPLVLAALDEYMYTRRRGLFAAAVFASCLFNYYFFVGQVVFVILYWFVRMFAKSWKITLKDFFWLLFESILGVLGTAVLLLPTILTVIQNPRVDNPPQGWSALLYGWEQRYVHILQSLFFPPDIPARPNFAPDSEAKWASLGAWLPMFSMTGVIAWFQIKRHHWLKRLLCILLFMAMIPILNSSFQLFNSSYYARWFYMLTLMLSLCTLMSLENARVDWKRALKWTAVITLGIAIPIGFMPKSINDGQDTQIGLMNYSDRFWIYVAISMLSLVMLAVLIRYLKRDKKRFVRLAIAGTAAITVLYSSYMIGLGKSQSYSTHDFIIPYSLKGGKTIDLPDTKNCRADVYNGMDNQAMFWQIPTIQTFHSIVPGSIMEFYPSIGVKRDVGSRADTSTYGLRGLTSCRWLFDYAGDDKYFNSGTTEFPDPAMPGWTFYDTQNGFDIWENDYFIPYGFTYDSYITREQYDGVVEANRNLLLLKTMVLDDEAVSRNADILARVEDPKTLAFDREAYFRDCLNRRELTCSSFSHDNTGFTGEITVPQGKDQLVFFSVPYENGWSATVNGKEVVIEKVNVGFMAVRVPAGQTSTIRFDYMTPGLIPGLCITLGCFAVFLGYLLIFRKKRRRPAPLPDPGRRVYRVIPSPHPLPECPRDEPDSGPPDRPI